MVSNGVQQLIIKSAWLVAKTIMKQKYENFNKLVQESHNKQKYTIFLSKEQKATLYKIKYDYKLSVSTIAYILLWHYYYNEKIHDLLFNEQYYTTSKKYSEKTAIKIINTWEDVNAKVVNNALLIYLNKIDQKVLDAKTYEKLRNEIHNKFNNTIDPLWSYNENYRQNWYVRYYLNKGI